MCICPVVVDLCFCSVSFCEHLFGLSSRLGKGRNIRAVKSDHFEGSAKASARPASNCFEPTRAICGDLSRLEYIE